MAVPFRESGSDRHPGDVRHLAAARSLHFILPNLYPVCLSRILLVQPLPLQLPRPHTIHPLRSRRHCRHPTRRRSAPLPCAPPPRPRDRRSPPCAHDRTPNAAKPTRDRVHPRILRHLDLLLNVRNLAFSIRIRAAARTQRTVRRFDFLARRLQEYRRTSVDVFELAWVDAGHLEDEDASADDEEAENDGDDLGGGGFEALVEDGGGDKGAEGKEDVVCRCY